MLKVKKKYKKAVSFSRPYVGSNSLCEFFKTKQNLENVRAIGNLKPGFRIRFAIKDPGKSIKITIK